jgi:hypothetical protein
MALNPPVDAAGDALAEAEGELRVAKTSLAVALQDKEEVALQLQQTRRSLMAAIQQLTLVQQVRLAVE